jgi:hypothetical protein
MAPSATLSYACNQSLVLTGTHACLTFTITNGTTASVGVDGIALAIPNGGGDTDLIEPYITIPAGGAACSDGSPWLVSVFGNQVWVLPVASSRSATLAAGAVITFSIPMLPILATGAGQSATIAVAEYRSGSLEAGTASLMIAKAGAAFTIDNFSAILTGDTSRQPLPAYAVDFGQSITVSWSASQATSCQVTAESIQVFEGQTGGSCTGVLSTALSGSTACTILGATIFTLTVSGPAAGGGTQTATAQFVAVSAAPPPQPYTGDRVLVPIRVSAMIVTNLLAGNKTFSTMPPNLFALKAFSPPAPQPFSSAAPPTGVTLHWTLPDALKQGTTDQSTSETVFPHLPNRWLITRFAPSGTAPSGRTVSAWVIRSDYTGNGATVSFALPTVRQFAPILIGQSQALTAWNGEPSGAPLFLDAMGDGNPAFLAYTAGLTNVFSFQDPATDVTTPNARLTYTVAGWYSDPAEDFLASATTSTAWKDLMTSLGWNVTQPDVPVYPAQLACYGSVSSVFWSGADYNSLCTPDNEPLSGVPLTSQTISSGCPGQPSTTAVIAVGNTPLDAFASLAEYTIDPPDYDALTLLQAFFYDELIDYGSPTGEVRLTEKVRQTWFGSQTGGTCWTIVNKQRSAPADGQQSPPPKLSDTLIKQLAALNVTQRELDAATRRLHVLQKELYNLWWKGANAARYGSPIPPNIQEQIAQAFAATRLETMELLAGEGVPGSIAALTAARNDAGSTLRQGLGLADPDLRVVEQALPKFFAPNDPVLLITGAVGSDKHGSLARLRSGTTDCRVSGQLLDAWSVAYDAGAGTVTLTAGADPGCSGTACAVVGYSDLALTLGGVDLDTQLKAHAVPADTAALALEAYLLDPASAQQMLTIALTKMGQAAPSNLGPLVQQFQHQQAQFVTDPPPTGDLTLIPAATGATCVPPAAIATAIWKAPWAPLFMDWKVMWYPAVDTSGGTVSQWTFSPDNGTPSIFQWNGGVLSNGIQLQGRTVLTSGATQLLSDWLTARLDQNPKIDTPHLRSLAEEIAGWDVLAQSIGGFNEQLVQLLGGQHIAAGSEAAIIGAGDAATPIPGAPGSPPPFHPLRAGQLVVQELWIVDDFGQVYDPVQGADYLAVVAAPGVGLETDGAPIPAGAPPLSITRSAFAPAIVQASRLDFGFIAANQPASAAQPITVNPFASPVCGYLLRNLLDRDVSVYDSDGVLLGSLYVSGTNVLQWEPDPERVTSVGQPPDIANEYLLAIVNGLLKQSDSAAAFTAFIDELDLIVTKLDLSGAHYNQGLAALIGRPIAVVRARLSFEYAGGPLYNQAWAETGTLDTGGIEQIRWPVHLGGLQLPHDGVYGYYVDTPDLQTTGYQTFHVVYQDPELRSNDPPYVTPSDITMAFADEDPTYVTLLMEPSSSVYAITGILPHTPVALPGAYTQGAIQNMDVVFRTGPLLSDPAAIKIIRPSNVYGSWSWIEHTGVQISTQSVARVQQTATFTGKPPNVRAGWLRLANAFASSGTDPDTRASTRPSSPFRAPYFRSGR